MGANMTTLDADSTREKPIQPGSPWACARRKNRTSPRWPEASGGLGQKTITAMTASTTASSTAATTRSCWESTGERRVAGGGDGSDESSSEPGEVIGIQRTGQRAGADGGGRRRPSGSRTDPHGPVRQAWLESQPR